MERRGVGRYEDAGREILICEAVALDDAGVRHTVADVTGQTPEVVIASADRGVVWHMTRVEQAIRAAAWRERPITPDPKPRDRKRRRERVA